MRKAKSSRTLWPTCYVEPAKPVGRVFVWYLIAVLAGILFGMAQWGFPGGGA